MRKLVALAKKQKQKKFYFDFDGKYYRAVRDKHYGAQI